MSCGCNKVPLITEEEEITLMPLWFDVPVVEECPINIDELKEKVICDVLNIILQLECGIQPDLELILEEISFIEIYDE